MSVNHVNFYENLKEAQMRIEGTIVMYDSKPYNVVAICNHKPNGVFRVYLRPAGLVSPTLPYPNAMHDYNRENTARGAYLDAWLEQNPTSQIIRKEMNSPHFNKFRPFPLGMCNQGTHTFYVERQPTRNREQGLTRQMLFESIITLGNRANQPRSNGLSMVDITRESFAACILGQHPSAAECLEALLDPEINNESVAFHREFAFVRGPLDIIFLAYKSDIVATLPKGNFAYLKLGAEFGHVREAVEDLQLFNQID